MRHCHVVVALLTVVALAGAARAAEIEIPRRVPENISIQKGPPNCSRWTDNCVNCSRDGKDEPPVCSNIGFACQPQAIRCLSPAVSRR
jgi:hypothetical protein